MPVILFDSIAIIIAWYGAYWLRFNMRVLPEQLFTSTSLGALLLLWSIQMFAYYYFKVYRGLWRFASLADAKRIIKACISTTFFSLPFLYFTAYLQNLPRSILPLYTLLLIIFLCAGRFLIRSYWDRSDKSHVFHALKVSSVAKQVLIIGAGRAGESLARDLKRNPGYYPLGFLDDNLEKKGLEVHGIRVLGTSAELPALLRELTVDLIFIAIPSASSAEMRQIVEFCAKTRLPFHTLPSLSALAAGQVQVNDLRKVNIEDLLGRDQAELEWDKILSELKEKNVLVTGGGGSIGSELCRQIMRLGPKKLLLIDHSEYNLYQLEQELRASFPEEALEFALISVTDQAGINHLFQSFQPNLVFHAAAYKHVPLLEHQVRVAVLNNVMGTFYLAEASVNTAVEKFILISTDKAVNPTNVMGTTKRIAEIYCQNLNVRSSTQFITVRFGNVLGSAGSVLPLFQKQLQEGGPLTVTHPDVERYFMTIPEAAQLILQAMVKGNGGEIFVLDMGEPVKISYLAEQIIRLSGKEPGKDIQIEYIGLRPGEKLFEELFHSSEELSSTDHKKLFKAKVRQLEWQELTQAIRLLNHACINHNQEEVYILLKNLVPEFSPQLEPIFSA